MQLLRMRAEPARAGPDPPRRKPWGHEERSSGGSAWRRHLGVVLTLAGEEGPEEEPR